MGLLLCYCRSSDENPHCFELCTERDVSKVISTRGIASREEEG